jgi:hypothetical protein
MHATTLIVELLATTPTTSAICGASARTPSL